MAIRKKNQRGVYIKPENIHKINEKITSPTVRVTYVSVEVTEDAKLENVSIGVYQTHEALKIAQNLDLDLVEISSKADPPICKIIDYKKFLYQEKKRKKEQQSQKTVVKEIRFGPNTSDHDFQFKLKHAKNFLTKGFKVKAWVLFKGRSIVFKDQGEILLLKLATELEDFGIVESMPKLDKKKMTLLIKPK